MKIYISLNDQKSLSKAYNNIAVVYKSMHDYPKALEYLQKALKIQQQNAEETVAVTLANIGNIYFEMHNYNLAFSYYQKSEKLFKNIDNVRNFALLNSYFGDYYKKIKNDIKAFEYYNKALETYNKIENLNGASLVLLNLGQMNYDIGKFTDALPQALKSLQYAKETGVIDQTIFSEKLTSDIYLKLNNPTESLNHYKQYIVFRDSLNNENNTKKFKDAEENFEIDKKNSLMQEKQKRQSQLTLFAILGGLMLLCLIFVIYNRMQVKKRLTLQKEVAEYEQKALHLQMNPHFVFNCLGSISSFIVQNGTDSAIKYLTKFSKLMRLTLEYSKNSLIPIDKEIEGLQNYLELEQLRFNQKFKFLITSNPNIEDYMALPPLLIQPFVENAILHGMVPKIGNGRININFDITDKNLICTIIDDGIGLTKSKQLKENSVKAHQSMALEITKKRLEMMENGSNNKSELKIDEIIKNNEVVGTKVVLNLPIQYIK
ncbi:MAG: tetratricopeptide repeat protein [Flavobacterium sp.]|nr:tetratricopeptide repeat protein [Flavobacterium sp.]